MLKELFSSQFFTSLESSIKEDRAMLAFASLWPTPKALILAFLAKVLKRPVIFISENIEEGQYLENLPLLCDNSFHYPSWETLPTENIPPSPDIVGMRFKVLQALLDADKTPPIVLMGLQAALQRVVSKNLFSHYYHIITEGEEVPFEALIESLVWMGYERRHMVVEKGEFSVRGGIIDIFSSFATEPYRIEFFGDEVESIRSFDPIGQKSIDKLKEVILFPSQEKDLVERAPALITDYLPKNAIIIYDDLKELEQKYADITALIDSETNLLLSSDELKKAFEEFSSIAFVQNSSEMSISSIRPYPEDSLQPSYFLRLRDAFIAKDIHRGVSDSESITYSLFHVNNTYNTYFYSSTPSEESHLKEVFAEHKIALPESVSFKRGYLSAGFVEEKAGIACLPYAEIFRRYKIRRQKQRGTFHTTPVSPFELETGDYVVHISHGIGKFQGFIKKNNHLGIEADFMQVEYADRSLLFIPLDQAHLVSKYIGAKNEKPTLHTIGSAHWTRTKVKTERAINDYAAELLDFYARRKLAQGYAFPQNSKETMRFVEEFPYVETEDQLKAIENINHDMEQLQPMDRLVCGDVGYGKTEVAIRAAFKAVAEGGRQVAILVPTTVLAMQHFENFSSRMQNFPINIAHLSRFVSAKESRQIIEEVGKGKVDILIGTHRILSKDISFKNLGLIIVDEEQRFGVKAKEHLKRIKEGVDSLALSATPIPRTLYMSLVGVRDLSVINTPPQDRVPIKTIIAEFDENMLKTALQRELARGGQAYVIHNRVESLHKFAEKIQKLVPQATIVIGHGQMDADVLDEVFHTFKSGRADIFIGTTIVENGIDIPNANTIIVDRADSFGLADLYQLRGRVGRWNRRAYAYLLTPPNRVITEVSQKRLKALEEAGGYGGGMKIAMRDLEIRGGGEILGAQQSGHVSAVGFHLYCKLLKQTIARLQGDVPKIFIETKVEFPYDARLTEQYIEASELRMEIYQRLGEAQTNDEITDLYNELIDRFGAPPIEAEWLFAVSRVKLFASMQGVISLTGAKNKLYVKRRIKGKVSEDILPMSWPDDPEEFTTYCINYLKERLSLAYK